MTAEPRWIAKKALLLLHEESLAQFGGARGLRDEGLLDSALARPQNAYAYNAECTIAGLAASYRQEPRFRGRQQEGGVFVDRPDAVPQRLPAHRPPGRCDPNYDRGRQQRP